MSEAKPGDFSFLELTALSELPERAGYAKPPAPVETKADILNLSGSKLDAQPMPTRVKPKARVSAVRLSYNQLSDLNNIDTILEEVMENPLENLTSLDLSHNHLETIPSVLLKFKNLSVLYLHANRITKISEVNKLVGLVNLQKLTLHGNMTTEEDKSNSASQQKTVTRLEETSKFYRLRVIYTLRNTMLRAFDFITVTPRDRETALLWSQNYRPKPRLKDSDSQPSGAGLGGLGIGVGGPQAVTLSPSEVAYNRALGYKAKNTDKPRSKSVARR